MNFLKRKRAKRIASWVVEYLKPGEKVVDIGAGDCVLSHFLQEMSDIEIFPIDVSDYSETHLKPIVYDGSKLPFPNNYFDSALLLFVLHYVEDPLLLLREAQRVAKKRVIILQDVCDSYVSTVPTLVWGYFANLRRHSDRRIPYALSDSKLKNCLDALDLKLVKEQKFSDSISLYSIEHQLFIAEVSDKVIEQLITQ